MLKRSILLLKTYFTYESSLLGSQYACLATYGLYTLVIYILNCFSKQPNQIADQESSIVLKTEIDVFKKFFEIFGEFKWDTYMITIFGPIKIHNFYERLRDDCNFDIHQLAINERMEYFNYSS